MTLDEMRAAVEEGATPELTDVQSLMHLIDASAAEADWFKGRIAELETQVADLTAQIMGSR